MKSNLIYFTPKSATEKRAILQFLPAFSYATMSNVVSHIEFQSGVASQDVKPFLCENSLIMLDFSNDEQFQLIQSAVNTGLKSSIQNTSFGGFCEGAGKKCVIVNIGKPLDVDVEELQKLYNSRSSICLKMWGITANEVKEKCASVNNFSSLNHVILDSFGDITLAVESCDHSYLLQELYQIFSQYIYFEGYDSLFDCVADLCSVRKREFGLLDFAGGEFISMMTSNSLIKPFCVDLQNFGVTKSTTLDEIRSLLSRRKLGFIVLLAQQKTGYKVIFIDEDVHSFDVPNESNYPLEYLKNFALFKIFNKLRKNVLY